MKIRSYLPVAACALLLATVPTNTVFANAEHHAAGEATAAVDSAEAVAAYPLTTCVVSGDALGGGDMGPPVNYVHKEEGKPDRLVRFCCKSCIRDFKKDPATYLKKIDDAANK
ncbi:MAG TPA: hypothetical protein PKC67_01740 [Kiritimatiellia bacterium]|nr:hypothetical protein [Kiritimatiellia bacterium]HMP33045.1 hypothetical protein [Kiritimatiellia bacterium]